MSSAAASSSVHQTLDWLIHHGFMRADQSQEFRSNPARFPDPHALAKELVSRNWITPYQANQLLNGNAAELVLGDYRLMERLGEGAMGQVYKAWNTRLGRIVAVKMLHKDHLSSSKAMKRFRQEIETASKLDHPNIVMVRDADEVQERPYLVMDFIDGIDLARKVKQQGMLPVAEAVEYARQAAVGLQHAFEKGVVHRDVKPGNLLVLRLPDDTPQVKILDFGLARFESEREQKNRLTMMGALLGTVDYVAPEQAENAQNADIRADVFSLGCTLFYLLTGRPPYDGATVVEKVTARLLNPPPSLRAFRPDAPEALEAVLKKMMARRPENRYQTPLETAKALQGFAPPPTASGLQRLNVQFLPDPSKAAPAFAPAGADPLAFSSSNYEIDSAKLLGKGKVDAMSSGSQAFHKLIRSNKFLLLIGAGFLFVIVLLVVIVLSVAR